MSVLSISRRPRERENSEPSNPVNLVERTGTRKTSLPHLALLQTPSYKIPADCYRNGATNVERRGKPPRLGKTAYVSREYRSTADDAAERPPFTVVICRMPAGCFNGDATGTIFSAGSERKHGSMESIWPLLKRVQSRHHLQSSLSGYRRDCLSVLCTLGSHVAMDGSPVLGMNLTEYIGKRESSKALCAMKRLGLAYCESLAVSIVGIRFAQKLSNQHK